MASHCFKRLTALGLTIAAMPSTALAAPGAGLSSLMLPAINFTIYFLLMVYLFKKFASPALKARKAEIEGTLQKSDSRLREASAKVEKLESRLIAIGAELQEVRSNFSREGDKLEELIISNAHQEAEAIRVDAIRRSELEYQQAVNEIREFVASDATRIAHDLIQNQISDEIDRRLRKEAVRELIDS